MDNILKKVKGYYESSLEHPSYTHWLASAREAWNFYDGNQWADDEISTLHAHGQPAIVINKIAAKIDNIAGTEIASRTRVVYRSRSGVADEEATARALSDLALYVAERNDQSIELSQVFRAGLVTGIGWLDVGVESQPEGPFIFNRAENELDVVWDPTSSRLDYSDARFVCRHRWLDEDDVTLMFPQVAESLLGQLARQQKNFARLGRRQGRHQPDGYTNSAESRVKVVEVQYKQTALLYTATNSLTGEKVSSFNQTEITSLQGYKVETSFAPQLRVAYFSDDVLLQDSPLPYSHNQFTLVPYIFKRQRATGAPYGLVASAIDPQRELNKRRSKAMHMLNTSQVIADIDAVEDPSLLAKEAARPDGIILKRPGKELRIVRNSDLAASQFSIMEQAGRDIHDVMGVYDEALGKPSNAVSGLAIQQRQIASTMNQMFAFDALRRTKKQLGLMVLSLIREVFTSEMAIQITDNLDAPRLIQLNQLMRDDAGQFVYDTQGKPVTINNLQLGTFDIHVEEVHDALSGREHELNQLLALAQAGVQIPPEFLVEASALHNKHKLLQLLYPPQTQPNPTRPEEV